VSQFQFLVIRDIKCITVNSRITFLLVGY